MGRSVGWAYSTLYYDERIPPSAHILPAGGNGRGGCIRTEEEGTTPKDLLARKMMMGGEASSHQGESKREGWLTTIKRN
jgi:hypothetical protein